MLEGEKLSDRQADHSSLRLIMGAQHDRVYLEEKGSLDNKEQSKEILLDISRT